jgi:hypothetical protein
MKTGAGGPCLFWYITRSEAWVQHYFVKINFP